MSIDKEQRALNVSFSKSGSGSITSRLSIPISWLKEIGVTPDCKQVVLIKDGDKIILKKSENNQEI